MSKGQHEKWKNKNRIQNEKTNFFYNVFLYFGLHVDANELRRKLARGGPLIADVQSKNKLERIKHQESMHW